MSTAVLLSTYKANDNYLQEQLASIDKQTYRDFRLIRRDDSQSHMGAMHSFEQLLAENEGYEYYAFADQDDVWQPNKLAVLHDVMHMAEDKYGKETPIVVHSDLEVVDAKLNTISDSFWSYSGLEPHWINNQIEYLTISNTVTGCAMLLNAVARRVSLPFGEQAHMHDQWIAQSVLRHGGKIIPVDCALIRYRQHGNNTLGAIKHTSPLRHLGFSLHLAKIAYKAGKGICWQTPVGFIYWKIRHWLRRKVK